MRSLKRNNDDDDDDDDEEKESLRENTGCSLAGRASIHTAGQWSLCPTDSTS